MTLSSMGKYGGKNRIPYCASDNPISGLSCPEGNNTSVTLLLKSVSLTYGLYLELKSVVTGVSQITFVPITEHTFIMAPKGRERN